MKLVRALITCVVICAVLLCGTNIASAQASVSPQGLAFVYQIGGNYTAAQSLFVSAGSPTSFTVTVAGAPWLSVAPLSGTTPSTLVCTVTPLLGMTPGVYAGQVIIGPVASTDAAKLVVSVSLQVLAASQGNLAVSPNSLTFDYTAGGPLPSPRAVSVTSTGSEASFSTSTSASWLYTSASSYVTPSTLQISVNPMSSMAPGVYAGYVYVTPTYSGGSQQQIYVTLRISSGGNLTPVPTYMSFNYQPGGLLPAAQTLTVLNSTGIPVNFSVSSSTVNGGAWLSYSPSSGMTSANIVVSANPANLGAGTYNGTITITSPTAGIAATQIPVTLTIYGSSQLVAAPTSLNINYQAAGTLPSAQYVSVTSTGSAISYTIATQGLSWLWTTTTSGTTPSGFGVNITPPSGVVPGTYTATITLTPKGGGDSAVSIPVWIYVTAANYLTLGRSTVSFNCTIGGTTPAPEIVPVSSSGGSLKFSAVASTQGSSPWLSVTQSNQYTPANVSISVSPQGLSAGTYTGTVLVSSDQASNSQQSIAVTLVVSKNASLSASPFALVFSYQMGEGSASPQLLTVSSQGIPTAFTVTTKTKTGGNWLMAVGNGTTPATVGVAANADTLGSGTYTGQIQITPTDPSIPVLEIPVVFNVSPGAVFQPTVSEVVFQYKTGGPTPAAQQVAVDTNTGDPAVFYPTVLTADDGTWLSVTPDVASTPTKLTVTVDPKGLTAGFYYGVVALNDPGGAVPISFVPVTLQISDSQILTVPSQTLIFSSQTGLGPMPAQQITVKGTGQASAYHVTTNGGSWLSVSPTDGYTDAKINVTANMDSLAPGYYLGVVSIEIPGVANSQQLVPVVMVISHGFTP